MSRFIAVLDWVEDRTIDFLCKIVDALMEHADV